LFLIATPEPSLTPYFNGKGELHHRCDSRGALRGTVHWFGGGNTYRQRQADCRTVRDVSARLERLNDHPSAGDPNWIRSWSAEFEALSDARLEFVLYRTGELRISGSLDYYHGSLEEKIRGRRIAARHAYYFIKDCAHHHHHHHPTDDQLLPLVRLSDAGLSEDAHWRREVLWALTRVIGQFRRASGNVRRRQALGVIAYAEAFQMTLARVRRRSTAETHIFDDSLASFRFEQQQASIEVAKEVDNWQRQSRFSLLALSLASLISLLSLWGVAARFAAELKWGQPYLFWFDLPKTFYIRYETFLLVVLSVILLVYDRTLRVKSYSEVPYRAALGLAASMYRHRLAALGKVFWGTIMIALWGFIFGLLPW
jgi:hypothetical protein